MSHSNLNWPLSGTNEGDRSKHEMKDSDRLEEQFWQRDFEKIETWK